MPKKQTNTDPKDPFMAAFQEEKACLLKVEKELDSIIAAKDQAFIKAQSDLRGFVAYDYSDISVKKELINDVSRKESDLSKWQSYKGSPYFGRLEMTDENESTHSYLIGEEVIGEGTNLIVLDWRDPIANLFYQKRELHFLVNGKTYDLRLRRAVTIKDAKLKAVNTEYDYSDWTPKGEIVDPFLLSVLEDKRRDYKLTDIIRSIQANQNDIIKRPLEESFTVQGCAGSGKTMILLHRLSTIAFNTPNIDFNRFVIITPNENFNIHVDELSKHLGLDKIKKYTAEEFYARLTERRIDASVGSETERRAHKAILKPTTDRLLSEKLLDAKLLSYLYSLEFFEHTCNTFREKANGAIKRLQKLDISGLLRKHHYNVSDRSVMNYASYTVYLETIEDALYKHTTANNTLQLTAKRLASAEDKYKETAKETEIAISSLENAKKELVSLCENKVTLGNDELQTIQQSQETAQAEYDHANQEKASLFNRIHVIEESLARIDRGNDDLFSETYIMGSSEEIATVIRSECNDLLLKLHSAQEEMDNLVFYNFGRRARLRSAYNDALQEIKKQVETITANYRLEKKEELTSIRAKIRDWDNAIERINRDLSTVSGKIRSAQATISLFSSCLSKLSLIRYPDLEMVLSRSEYSSLASIVENYQSCLRLFRSSERQLQAANATRERYSEEQNKLQASMLEDSDYRAFSEGLAVVKTFEVSSLYREFEESIQAVYRQYGQKYLKTPNYRHKLYLRLLFSTLYYGPVQTGEYYLNIDEAQDFAPAELKLMKYTLGNKVVFNLYGDVNQSIYEYKGIMDWSDLHDITSKTIYHLNENYRNTIEITDYCNKEFDADIIAVGLSGAPVRKLTIEEASAALVDIHTSNPNMRCAIIYKRGLEGLTEELTSLLPSIHAGFSWNTSVFSCLTVEECKGLEFDAALVVTNNMSVNEQYIAYTRALDHLIITSSSRAFFKSENNFVDEEPADDVADIKASAAVPTASIADTEEVQLADEPAISNEASTKVIALPKQAVDLSIIECGPYVQSFFMSQEPFIDAFRELSEYARQADNRIMIRVKEEYIGFAKKDERCLLYVTKKEGRYLVKFIHLYAPEEFVPEKVGQYKRLMRQALTYSMQFSIKLKQDTI